MGIIMVRYFWGSIYNSSNIMMNANSYYCSSIFI